MVDDETIRKSKPNKIRTEARPVVYPPEVPDYADPVIEGLGALWTVERRPENGCTVGVKVLTLCRHSLV